MPRTARIDFPGARHHVGNRGARRATIFPGDDSRILFLSLLSELPARFDVGVLAYVLMTNHFHLLLACPRGNVAQAMRFIDGEYARQLNGLRDWDGPLFKSRYHNQVVDDDHYLRCLIAYIHLNPVVASMVADAADWEWTSHRYYAGIETPPDWLDLADAADAFGTPAAYLEFLDDTQMRRDVFPPEFSPSRLWRAPTRAYPIELPDYVPAETIDVAAELALVADVAGVDVSFLSEGRRGPAANRERWLLAWWLTRGVGVRPAEVARLLRIDRSGVTRMVQNAVNRAAKGDVWLTRAMERLHDRRIAKRNKRPPP